MPWWGDRQRTVTLHQILVHMVAETQRHAGHADIVRERSTARPAAARATGNMDDGYDWPAYVAERRAAATAAARDA